MESRHLRNEINFEQARMSLNPISYKKEKANSMRSILVEKYGYDPRVANEKVKSFFQS